MGEARRDETFFAAALGGLVGFAALAKGAHDLWAATVVQVLTLLFFLVFLVRRRHAFPVRFVLPLVLFLAALAASFPRSIYPGDTIWAFKDYAAAGLLFLMASDVFEAEQALKRFLLIIGGVAVVEFLLIAAAKLGARLPQETAGTLINANISSFFFLALVPVFAGIKGPFARAAALLCAASILLSFSYSALALVIVAWPLYAGFRPFVAQVRQRPKFFALTAVGLVVFFIALYFYREHQVAQWRRVMYYPSSHRWDWWKAGFKMFFDHPLTGVGLGNYQHAYLAYKTGSSQNTLYAHNGVVTILSETGLIGLTGLLIMAAAWLAALRQNNRVEERWPFLLALLMMFFYAGYNIGVEYFIGKIMIAILAGIVAGKGRVIKMRLSVVIVLVAFGVSALPYLITPFLASQNLVVGRMMKDSDPVKAAAALQSAVKLDPLSSEAHAELGRVLAKQGHIYEAREEMRRAARLDRLNAPLWWELRNYERWAQEAGF